MRKLIWIIGIVLFVFAIGPIINTLTVHAATGVTVGKTIPVFSASNLDGQNVQVGLPGKPYVLNFWATWCPPCRDEFPEINQFANQHAADVQFYAIDLQESSGQVSEFLNRNGYNLPVLLDLDGSVARELRINAIPTTIVVDGQGVIRYRKTGGVTMSELENVVNGL